MGVDAFEFGLRLVISLVFITYSFAGIFCRF